MRINIDNYYLDLNRVDEIKDDNKRNNIHNYYRDMVFAVTDNNDKASISFFNTLYQAGYLLDVRVKKLKEILGDDDNIGD